jgi:hypothetical protein
MYPRSAEPELSKLPRMGPAGRDAAALTASRPAPKPLPRASAVSLEPAEAARLRCAAALLALLATVCVQAVPQALSLALGGTTHWTSILVVLGAGTASAAILRAMHLRRPSRPAGGDPAAHCLLESDRIFGAGAAALLAFGGWRLVERVGPAWAVMPARFLADLLALIALYRAWVLLLDGSRLRLGVGRCWPLAAPGLVPSLVPLAWVGIRWLLEREAVR